MLTNLDIYIGKNHLHFEGLNAISQAILALQSLEIHTSGDVIDSRTGQVLCASYQSMHAYTTLPKFGTVGVYPIWHLGHIVNFE